MKTVYKTIIAAAAGSMLIVGCSKISELETKFLTVESIGKSTIASFFQEVSGVTSAGEGLHHELENFMDSYYFKYGDITGEDLCINTVAAGEGDYLLYNFMMKPEHVATYPRNVWGNGWGVVTNANNLIYYGGLLKDKGGHSESDLAKINQSLGWAYFCRAFAHFAICNVYAQPYCYTADASHIGIPVVTNVPKFDDEISRESVATVYKQILADIQTSYDLLKENDYTADRFHISSLACEAFFARVYLYMQDYANAEKYSKMVMDKISLTGRDEYVNMFRNPFADKGKETIFRLNQYDGSSTLVSCYDPTRNGGNDFYPCPEMYDIYESDDVRLQLLTYVAEECEETYYGQSFKAVCKPLAFKSIADKKEMVPCPFVFRGSEMYLIHAEAVANGASKNLAAAVEDLKALEARARGVDASSIELDYTDLASVNRLIKKERVRELCYEGHSVFDCIRRGEGISRPAGSNAEVKSLEFGDHRLILPIDQMEMQANEKMVQNEGY